MVDTYTVLLVEPTETCREVVPHLLSKHGGKGWRVVVGALHETEAAWRALSPRVVLLCVAGVPDNGLAAIRRVTSSLSDVPVVVIGRDEQQAEARVAIQHGAQDYVLESDLIGVLLARSIEYAVERKRVEESLRRSVAEKEVLLREVHHRVKNNLQVVCSLLSLAGRKIDDPATRHAFDESRNRVVSMALVHDQLYRTRDFTAIDLGEYLRNVLHSLWPNVLEDPEGVELIIRCVSRSVSPDIAIPCGLILTELVTNAVRHGLKGRSGVLMVTLEASDSSPLCTLTVRDSGSGLPTGVALETAQSLGLDIVRALVDQLGGTITYTYDRGAVFSLSFSALHRTEDNDGGGYGTPSSPSGRLGE